MKLNRKWTSPKKIRIFIWIFTILCLFSVPLTFAHSSSDPLSFLPHSQALTKTISGYSYFHDNDGYEGFYGTSLQIGHEFDFFNEEWRGWIEWDISDIPETANITFAGIRINVTGIPISCDNQRAQLDMYQMTNQPSTNVNNPELLFNDAGDGLHYRENTSFPLSENGIYPSFSGYIPLSPVALGEINTSINAGWFAVGFVDYYHLDLGHNEDQDEGVIFEISSFQVNYTYEGQDWSQSYSSEDASTTATDTETQTISDDTNELGSTSIIIIAVTIAVILIAVGITQKRNQSRSGSQRRSLLVSKSSVSNTGSSTSIKRINEKKLLKKFKSIMEISQRVALASVATSLKISEKQLFELLLRWKKSLPVKIDGDFILIDDLSEFMGALDQEFSNWDHHQKTKDGKI